MLGVERVAHGRSGRGAHAGLVKVERQKGNDNGSSMDKRLLHKDIVLCDILESFLN